MSVKQVNEIDTNLLYEIGGLLDNVELLQYYICVELEQNTTGFKTAIPALETIRERALRLTYILDTQFKEIKKCLDTLLGQIENSQNAS